MDARGFDVRRTALQWSPTLESRACTAMAGGAMHLGAAMGWANQLQMLKGGEEPNFLTQRLLEL